MGREIRRVPKGFEHETQECPHRAFGLKYQLGNGCSTSKQRGDNRCYKPLYDGLEYEERLTEWFKGREKWNEGFKQSCRGENGEYLYPKYRWVPRDSSDNYTWEEHAGDAPQASDYTSNRSREEAICFQLYETVSEGTPISPVFETPAELVEWLVLDGGPDGPLSLEAATSFVADGYAPSMMITGGVLYQGTQVHKVFKNDSKE